MNVIFHIKVFAITVAVMFALCLGMILTTLFPKVMISLFFFCFMYSLVSVCLARYDQEKSILDRHTK